MWLLLVCADLIIILSCGCSSQCIESSAIIACMRHCSSTATSTHHVTTCQVWYGELLSRLFVQRSDFASAAAVYEALASRKHGPGEMAVTLDNRAALLHQAHLQVRRSCTTWSAPTCFLNHSKQTRAEQRT